jgi:hypothetical protein
MYDLGGRRKLKTRANIFGVEGLADLNDRVSEYETILK